GRAAAQRRDDARGRAEQIGEDDVAAEVAGDGPRIDLCAPPTRSTACAHPHRGGRRGGHRCGGHGGRRGVVPMAPVVVMPVVVAMWPALTANAYRMGWRGPVTLYGDSQRVCNLPNNLTVQAHYDGQEAY